MLSCNVLIAHSVGDLEGEIRIFVEAEPGFRLAFRIVPDGGIFFGVFSHGLQLAEVGGYGLVLYDIYFTFSRYFCMWRNNNQNLNGELFILKYVQFQ